MNSEKPHLAHVSFCKKCRDVRGGETCWKCGSRIVYAEGTIEQFKAVIELLMNDHGREARDILAGMVREDISPEECTGSAGEP